jgi:hypothetical protein
MYFGPSNAAMNLTGRLKVRFVPDAVTLAAPALTEH